MNVKPEEVHEEAVKNTEEAVAPIAAVQAGEKRSRVAAKDIFSAKNITRMAVFIALSYILYLPVFEFSLIPAVPFLKVDFSNAFVMMAAFALGPVAGIIVGIIKEILHALTFSQTVGIGELANIIMMLPYILIPAVMYKKRRTLKTVFITLPVACIAQAAWSIPVNYLLTFPFFIAAYGGTWAAGMEMYLSVWYWAVLFNFVKTSLITIVVMLLYKQFQRLFDRIFHGAKKLPPPEREVVSVVSPEQMEQLGARIAGELRGGDVILLTGELGAGKTVFCKGVAKGLGVTEPVVSPTFTLMNEYFGKTKFCHFDAYRLSDSDEAYGAGLSDFIGSAECICAVEWWENIADMFDNCKTVKIDIKKTENGREVTVTR